MRSFGKELVIKPMKPNEYLYKLAQLGQRKDHEQIENYKKCNEITFIGYTVKIFYQPSPEGANHPDSINQLILLSS